jgi:hypothetical protein
LKSRFTFDVGMLILWCIFQVSSPVKALSLGKGVMKVAHRTEKIIL